MENALSYIKIAQYVAAAIVMGLGALGACLAQAKVASKACECIAQNPTVEKEIKNIFFSGLLFIETSAIYCLVISIILLLVV